MYDNATIIHRHQFKSYLVNNTNNILRNTSCSLQCTNTGYLKILPSLQVNTDTIQNISSGLQDLNLENKVVSYKENNHEELASQEIDSLRESVDNQSEDQTFEDATAELNEIISDSQYLSYRYVFPIRIDCTDDKQRVMTTSPILRAPNPVPFNKPFMNNNYEK